MIFEFIKGTVNANYKLLDRYNSGLPVNVSYEHNYKDNAVVKRRNAINDTLLADAEVAFIMLAHRTAEHVLMQKSWSMKSFESCRDELYYCDLESSTSVVGNDLLASSKKRSADSPFESLMKFPSASHNKCGFASGVAA